MGSFRQLGQRGEEMAVKYLRRQGYFILERNYRTREGEIDVIAKGGETLVFVEVKTATGLSFGPPQVWVDRRKRARLVHAAMAYLASVKDSEPRCRFDVIAIILEGGRTKLTHIVDAFRLEDNRSGPEGGRNGNENKALPPFLPLSLL